MNNYYDARQHLSLSQLAFDTIAQDQYEFLEKPSRQGIINRIIESFSDDASASIDRAVLRYKETLNSDFAHIPDNETKAIAVSTLLETYRKKLVQHVSDYPSDISFKFQLNEHNFGEKAKWTDENGYYGGHPGRYYKAVIEEYARKSYYEREAIVLRKLISEIDLHIAASKLIIITLRGHDNRKYEIRPFSISPDPFLNYHYLIGYSRRVGTSYSEQIVSFRLSRISKVDSSSCRSGRITKEQEAEIRARIQSVGVQFLSQRAEQIQVKLSEQGKRKYESQAYMRPPYIRRTTLEDGTWLYCFDCSQLQAEYYFFKFGADAEVLTPISLRNKFFTDYSDACQAYETVNN